MKRVEGLEGAYPLPSGRGELLAAALTTDGAERDVLPDRAARARARGVCCRSSR